MLGGLIAFEEIWGDNLHVTTLILRLIEFFEDVGFHHVVIECLNTRMVQGKTTRFALGLTAASQVPIVLCTAAHKLHSRTATQFVRKLT